MPEPKENETREQFINRCIPTVLDDGTAENQDQAAAICYSIWENQKSDDGEAIQMKTQTMNNDFVIKEFNQREDNWVIEGIISSSRLDRAGEIILPEAYERTLKMIHEQNHKIKVLWQHDRNEPIGVSIDLKKLEDNKLWAKFLLPKDDTHVNGRVMPQVRVGSIDTLSIGFQELDSYVSEGKKYYKDIIIKEFSMVTFECNQDARITGFKSIDVDHLTNIDDYKQFEKDLRKGVRLSKSAATKLMSLINKGLEADRSESEKQQSESVKESESEIILKMFAAALDKLSANKIKN